MGNSLYKEAKTRHDKEIEKKRARGEDVSAEIAAHRHLAIKEIRREAHGENNSNRKPERVDLVRRRHRLEQSSHKTKLDHDDVSGRLTRVLAKSTSFDALNPYTRSVESDRRSQYGTAQYPGGHVEHGNASRVYAKGQYAKWAPRLALQDRLDSFKKQKSESTQAPENSHESTNTENRATTRPKLLSTRRRKALAAGGGALAVAGLGAYAYKRHLDKKREEANGK